MCDKLENEKILHQIIEYCDYYNLPIHHIDKIISGLKVIPMIRGIGFEYTVSDILKRILSDNWIVSNPNINAQSEIHDVDVNITRKKDNKKITIECKLAKKDSFKLNGGVPIFNVKCMRSRTVSDNEVATKMARKYGILRDLVLFHADNYRDNDFEYVITSMGNVFWITKDTKYIFKYKDTYSKALSNLFPSHFSNITTEKEFKDRTYNFLLIAKSSDIKVSLLNNVTCNRRRCINNGTDKDCGFIPNYPQVNLADVAQNKSPWKILEDINLDDYFENGNFGKESNKVSCSLSEFL